MAQIVWQGQYLTMIVDGRWEYVARARGIGAAVIVATDGDAVILVEQYRVPLGRRCLELPAGLVGDDSAGEAPLAAAARELEEETGYRAERIVSLGQFYSSPGMVSEAYELVRATELTRVGAGGGTADEGITVHRVPRGEIADFIAAKRAEGVAIDGKLLLLLGGTILG
ncbi:MAG: NUDIX hydrolase [Sphingomonas sp.]|uniref:NUDIX hydrolase n=1 Tax=Sphingomonas sp. TaxID=28214 RepID=UPI0025CEB296|nr:NUDIX hydrolase [Sphingomonas sp.]MBX9880908.1 NUDIX hydrolase [Sphingomonas sp.]